MRQTFGKSKHGRGERGPAGFRAEIEHSAGLSANRVASGLRQIFRLKPDLGMSVTPCEDNGPPGLAYTRAMDRSADGREHIPSERSITLSVVVIITLASIVLMLSLTSPELSWDEADYASNTATPWSVLWRTSDYIRHSHGPMAIYFAKLGQEVFPAGTVSLEVRLRFLATLVASLAVGLLYWMLRRSFKTSRAAALVGASLLLFSVIRLEETNIIGPHHLMLACTLAIVALGYEWRDRPTVQASLGLGAVMAFGALSMTYVVPAALCWAVAVSLAGREWFAWETEHTLRSRGRF